MEDKKTKIKAYIEEYKNHLRLADVANDLASEAYIKAQLHLEKTMLFKKGDLADVENTFFSKTETLCLFSMHVNSECTVIFEFAQMKNAKPDKRGQKVIVKTDLEGNPINGFNINWH